jgi:hypothetical protein
VRTRKGTKKGWLVDTEQSVDQQLLAHSKRQTAAQESLRTIAVLWTFFAVLGAVIWLIVTIAAG